MLIKNGNIHQKLFQNFIKLSNKIDSSRNQEEEEIIYSMKNADSNKIKNLFNKNLNIYDNFNSLFYNELKNSESRLYEKMREKKEKRKHYIMSKKEGL